MKQVHKLRTFNKKPLLREQQRLFSYIIVSPIMTHQKLVGKSDSREIAQKQPNAVMRVTPKLKTKLYKINPNILSEGKNVA